MNRTLLPLALIVLVLLGAWWIWPRAATRAPLAPSSAGATETPPEAGSRAESKVEAGAPAAQRSEQSAATTPVAEAQAQLVVRCVSRSGNQPLAGVSVRASSGDKWSQVLPTGADGRASFSVQAGTRLGVSAGDTAHFVSEEFAEVPALAAAETREVVLTHDAGEHAHFCGLVVARDGGAPVAGAQVSIEGAPRTTSDAQGRFELDFAAHMPPWLRVDAAGFALALLSPDPRHETPATARRIELARSAALEIALVSAGDEARLQVTLTGAARQLAQEGAFTSVWREVPPLVYQADADATGVCRFEALPPGVGFEAQVTGSSAVLFRSAEPLVLQPGERRRVEWDLGGAAIVGHMREPDGRPAAGIELLLLRHAEPLRYVDASDRNREVAGRTKSEADGSFRIGHVSPGSWLLAPAPTPEIAGVPQRVEVAPGAREVAAEVRLARGLFVRGKLVAPDGESGAPGYVYAFGALRGQVSTASDGTFVLGPLAPVPHSIVGSPSNDFLDSEALSVLPPAENVILRARPGAAVAGRVVDELGNGAQSSIAVVLAERGMTMTRTEPNGAFRLTGLAPGSYTLFASTNDGKAGLLADVVLSAEQAPAPREVVLRGGATLRVRYAGSRSGQIWLSSNGAQIVCDGLEPDQVRTQVVPPGRVSVEVKFPGIEERQKQELDVATGETRELLFTLPAK